MPHLWQPDACAADPAGLRGCQWGANLLMELQAAPPACACLLPVPLLPPCPHPGLLLEHPSCNYEHLAGLLDASPSLVVVRARERLVCTLLNGLQLSKTRRYTTSSRIITHSMWGVAALGPGRRVNVQGAACCGFRSGCTRKPCACPTCTNLVKRDDVLVFDDRTFCSMRRHLHWCPSATDVTSVPHALDSNTIQQLHVRTYMTPRAQHVTG